jgi:hypothetical protein
MLEMTTVVGNPQRPLVKRLIGGRADALELAAHPIEARVRLTPTAPAPAPRLPRREASQPARPPVPECVDLLLNARR